MSSISVVEDEKEITKVMNCLLKTGTEQMIQLDKDYAVVVQHIQNMIEGKR